MSRVHVILTIALTAALGAAQEAPEMTQLTGTWQCVTEQAAFSPRDTAEDFVFAEKMWLSNGYYHGNVLHRDLYRSEDGITWEQVSDATPYDGYAEMTVYQGKVWAVKRSVWCSEDGESWTQVLEKTPFGVRGYGELLVHNGRIFQLGSGKDVWASSDGATWECLQPDTGYEARSGSAVASYDGKLWVMGGSVGRPNDPPEKGYETITTLNDVWCSGDGETWECVLEHAPWAPRKWFVSAVYAGKLWIIGGYDNVHHDNFAEVWYTGDGVNWTRFASEPMWSSRHEPTVYVFDGSLWVVAGNHWPVTNDVWRLTLAEE